MDYLLDLLQGLGIAAAIGIRPFLPTLLAGALAAGDDGLDFDGTDFSFLEATGFLLAVVVLVAVFGLLDRRRDSSAPGPLATAILVLSLVLGALVAAGSLADHSEIWWPGSIGGAAAAGLGYAAARSLFGRVRA